MKIHINNNSFLSFFFDKYEVFYPSTAFVREDQLKPFVDALVSDRPIGEKKHLLEKIPASILIKNKKENSFLAISDYNGIAPLYYACIGENELFVGKNLREVHMLINQDSVNTDISAVMDMVLFNYPLKNRTLSQEVKRLPGGRLLKQTENEISEIALAKPAEIYHANKKIKNVNYSEITGQLEQFVKSRIRPELPVLLSMTGGFDSRVNFALLKKLGLPFEAYTFGNPNSNDAAPAQAICKEYGIKHHLLDLNQDFVSQKEKYFDRLVESSLGNPFILDVSHYEYVKEVFPPSNIITGFMGGEVLTGGSVGASQVTFTAMAKALLLSSSTLQLQKTLDVSFDAAFLNPELIQRTKENYLDGLSIYIRRAGDNRNENITNFLLSEKYSKFFGVVQSVFQGKHNQIDTFMAPEYLKIILNIPSSYTFSSPFERSAYINYLSRRLYAKIIEYANPSLLETKLDRGYKVGNLLNYRGIVPIAHNYYLNHTGRGNKLNVKTIDYKTWFSDFVFEALYYEKNYKELFNYPYIRSIIEAYRKDSTAYPVSVFNKLVVIYGIILALNKIKQIHQTS